MYTFFVSCFSYEKHAKSSVLLLCMPLCCCWWCCRNRELICAPSKCNSVVPVSQSYPHAVSLHNQRHRHPVQDSCTRTNTHVQKPHSRCCPCSNFQFSMSYRCGRGQLKTGVHCTSKGMPCTKTVAFGTARGAFHKTIG